jgi:hypothetical protein
MTCDQAAKSLTLLRVLFQWHYSPDPDPLSKAQVIIGMAFGANRKSANEDPGLSNIAIAQIIYKLWLVKRLPVIVQREVAEAISKEDIGMVPSLVIEERDNQFHIDSYEVIAVAWEYCKQHGLHNAILVAHPAHILRCMWVARKIGFQATAPNVSTVPYEPGSKHWWTRNKWSYYLWEFFARISWAIKGYL